MILQRGTAAIKKVGSDQDHQGVDILGADGVVGEGASGLSFEGIFR